MVLFAGIIFLLSLALIAALFALNLREQKTGRYPLSDWRAVADREALQFRELVVAADLDLKKIPPLLAHVAHVALHFAALEFARLAREASKQSHRLADFVSHKRNFERRETRSEFLKKMSGRNRGDDNGQDTSERVEF